MAVFALLVDDVVVKRFEVDKPSMTIGRHASSDIQIDEAAVSGEHARIIAQPSRYLPNQTEFFIEDLQSTNGTFVNGIQVQRKQLVNDDDVRIAWNTFKFVDDSRPNFERTAVIIDQTQLQQPKP